MIILGIDTATLACSVALLQNATLLAEYTLNINKTHSERLMPLLDSMLTESGIEREELGAVAVAAGPGSFTGLRIGIATARGLAQGLNIPAVSVGTLEALARSVPSPGVLICPLLDARRSQVYTALYRRVEPPGVLTEILFEPAAVSLDRLIEIINGYREPVVLVGEGVPVYAQKLAAALPPERLIIPPAPYQHCRAALVAVCALEKLAANPQSSYHDLLPQYLRQPEAERLAAEHQSDKEQ